MKKKWLIPILALALAAALCGCGKSEAVENAEREIASIGDVDASSLRAIEEAEAACENLSEKERSRVENLSALEEARAEYDALAANAVADEIARLGEISESSGGAIADAELAYDMLTEAQKDLVENYGELRAARERFDALCATGVEALIQLVRWDGESEPTAELREAIAAAQSAYDALTDTQRAAVRNYGELEETTGALSRFEVDRAQGALDTAAAENSGYAEADALYQALSAEQKSQITGYSDFAARWEDYKNRPPIELLGYSLGKNSISNPELYVKAQNVSEGIIKEFSMTVFAFDGDGLPVKVDFNDYSALLSYTDAVKPGEGLKSNSCWTLYGEYNEMKQVVIILRDVEFFDGTTWENASYGTLCEKYEQKMLEAGDENILPRA